MTVNNAYFSVFEYFKHSYCCQWEWACEGTGTITGAVLGRQNTSSEQSPDAQYNRR